MSLSKIYRQTGSFIPEQILPRPEHPSEPLWQNILTNPSSPDGHTAPFTPDDDILRKKMVNRPDPASQNQSHQGTASNATSAPEPAEVDAPPDLNFIRQQGFTDGVLEGQRQAHEDFGTCARTFQTACDQLTHLHETILQNNLSEMHTLVMLIAEKIIRHSIDEQKETILATVEETIRMAVKSEEFQIRINPDDLEIIKQRKQEILDSISGLDNIAIKADATIERGGCLLESANCTVDATIASQLKVIDEALQAHRNTSVSVPKIRQEH
jgi:flagellar assembly protein FliH